MEKEFEDVLQDSVDEPVILADTVNFMQDSDEDAMDVFDVHDEGNLLDAD